MADEGPASSSAAAVAVGAGPDLLSSSHVQPDLLPTDDAQPDLTSTTQSSSKPEVRFLF